MFNGPSKGALGPRWARATVGQRRYRARIVVVGNEKGGAGKSTVAALIATAMLYRGQRVAVIDLDLRQQSLSRLLANRRRWLPAAGVSAPMPLEYKLADEPADLAQDDRLALKLFEEALDIAMSDADLVVIDTPGSDTVLAQAALVQADLVVTPMNDSFVDFDVLGVVDPATGRVVRTSHYADDILRARSLRADRNRKLDWVVVRNRLTGTDTRNRERLDRALTDLANEIGFRVGPSLRERVAYREMFPFGLTLADVAAKVKPTVTGNARAAARDEVSALMLALGLSVRAEPAQPGPAAPEPVGERPQPLPALDRR